MDEEIEIINEKTRNEKIKDFFIKNKKLLTLLLFLVVIIFLSFYSFQFYSDLDKKKLSDKYNNATINYQKTSKLKTILTMKEIIKKQDGTYSPLALYFLIDNKLIENKDELNDLFDKVIANRSLEDEIRRLIIYKKALFNANKSSESELLEILRPILNSKSIWKSHSLYLIAEYFYSNNEKQKAKEFFEQVLKTENANNDIIKAAQVRLNRDLSE